jgi:hypothetical protein
MLSLRLHRLYRPDGYSGRHWVLRCRLLYPLLDAVVWSTLISIETRAAEGIPGTLSWSRHYGVTLDWHSGGSDRAMTGINLLIVV